MEEFIRSFLAVDIQEPLISHIQSNQTQLKQLLPESIRWVNVKNIHITIKFIGNLNIAHIPAVQKELEDGLVSFAEFILQPTELGLFPNSHKPQVIWMGINNPAPLTHIFRITEKIFQNHGYPTEKRKFTPHLTLGRIKKPLTSEEIITMINGLDAISFREEKAMKVSKVNLYKSRLTPSGPEYSEIFHIKFKTK